MRLIPRNLRANVKLLIGFESANRKYISRNTTHPQSYNPVQIKSFYSGIYHSFVLFPVVIHLADFASF